MTAVAVPYMAEMLRGDARIGVLYWPAGAPGHEPEDRVQLIITLGMAESASYLMTDQDAADIARLLTEAIA